MNVVSCMQPQSPCCLVCSNRSCCQSHSDPAILQGSEVRGQWGDTGIVGRCGVDRPGSPSQPWHENKRLWPRPLGSFQMQVKLLIWIFKSIARKHLSYNSLSSRGAERDTEDMRSFCHHGEKQTTKQSHRCIPVATGYESQCWHCGDTLATPGSDLTLNNKEVNVRNCGNFRFRHYDRHQRGHWLVDGGGSVPGAWGFTAAVNFSALACHSEICFRWRHKGSAGCTRAPGTKRPVSLEGPRTRTMAPL